MYQTTMFLKEGHVTDLDILEQAFACAKDGNANKELFPERQVREALERLRGTVYQYEVSRKERLMTVYEYGQLREMLMKGNEEFFKFLEGIFYRAEMNRDMKTYEIQMEAQKVFCSLYEDILEKYDYFDFYFEKEEFLIFENKKQISTEELYKEILSIATEMYDLLAKFRPDTDSELIGQVADYAWRNVEKNISLEKIADVFFVNKTYLSHLFKQETGRNFVNFFTEIRMLRSRVLLRHHCKVYECALQLGYEDTEYFSKVFKNYYGCKPTEYMAQQSNLAFHHNNRAACQQ